MVQGYLEGEKWMGDTWQTEHIIYMSCLLRKPDYKTNIEAQAQSIVWRDAEIPEKEYYQLIKGCIKFVP